MQYEREDVLTVVMTKDGNLIVARQNGNKNVPINLFQGAKAKILYKQLLAQKMPKIG